MDWKTLLSNERERQSMTDVNPYRNPFEMDYERVVASSSVRRLQDKTQVFPLQANDFTRTRLTHSLEVSSIGRSIGRRVAKMMSEKNPEVSKSCPEDFSDLLSSLLAVVGLVHDLGNPPFGHYGETIIRKWAQKNVSRFGGDGWLQDYSYFDGNAQTLRILARLQNISDNKGMNFTFGTLAALLKYPWSSAYCIEHQQKKLGFFFSERSLFDQIVASTGMKKDQESALKNPITLLLEAADDIAYLFDDIEDGYKKGCFSFDDINQFILQYANNFSNTWNIAEWIKKIEYYTKNMPNKEREMTKVNAIRIYFQGRYIETICNEFINNYDIIMQGKYNGELVNCSSLLQITDSVKNLCRDYIFNNNEVLMLELTGKTVLNSLLDKFSEALNGQYKNSKTGDGKLYALISDNFKHAFENPFQDYDIGYRKMQLVVDFISGMSDSYALNLHRSLTGINLPV